MALQGLTTYRQNNNIKSMVLLALFPVLLLALLGFIFLFVGVFADSREPFYAFHLEPVLGTGSAVDLALSAIYAWWPIVLGIAAVWVLIGYLFNDAIIHHATGAVSVTRAEQPELYNLVENLCISRGLTVPRLYIVDTDAMNAYASGIDERSYAITVTSGLLAVLDKDELEAVLAHELTHIMERDTRVLIVTIVFVGMISFLTQLLWRSIRISAFTRGRGENQGGMMIFLLIAAVAVVRRLSAGAGPALRDLAAARIPGRRRLGRPDQEPRRADLRPDENLPEPRRPARLERSPPDVHRSPAVELRPGPTLRHPPADRETHRGAGTAWRACAG